MAIIQGLNQHTDKPFGWHSWKVTPTETDELTGTVDIALDTLPEDTVILDCRVNVLTGDTSATSSALDVEIGAVELYDTGADSLGVGATFIAPTASGITAANAVLDASSAEVNCEITYVGTATVGPTFIVSILCGRVDY